MRRLFWLALGATLGVLIFRKLSRAADKLTPQGIAGSLGAGLTELSYSLRDFVADVRDAMSAQESALRAAAGLDSGGASGAASGAGLASRAAPAAELPAD
ncbi:MAG TPA: hypothetical protein VFD94_00445 [Jatrophihabitans sp.]|nr:hypothetical protein [Jatrophihabitans sp.]